MSQTPNYQLNQWDAGDRVLRTDFNADNAKIDGALKAEADARAAADSALNATLAKKGNCRLGLHTYTGTGTYGSSNPNTIRFTGGEPLMVLVFGDDRRDLLLHKGLTSTVNRNSSIGVSWASDAVSWFAYGNVEDQLNMMGWSYTAVLIYKLD